MCSLDEKLGIRRKSYNIYYLERCSKWMLPVALILCMLLLRPVSHLMRSWRRQLVMEELSAKMASTASTGEAIVWSQVLLTRPWRYWTRELSSSLFHETPWHVTWKIFLLEFSFASERSFCDSYLDKIPVRSAAGIATETNLDSGEDTRTDPQPDQRASGLRERAEGRRCPSG